MRDPDFDIPDPLDEPVCRYCDPELAAAGFETIICRSCAYEEKMESRFDRIHDGDV